MYLTTENAAYYLGKTIDCYERKWHNYPLNIQQSFGGGYCYVDRFGTVMPVPKPNDRINRVWFDIILEDR